MNERLFQYFFNTIDDDARLQLLREAQHDPSLKREYAEGRNMLALASMLPQENDAAYAKEHLQRLHTKMHRRFWRRIAVTTLKYAAIVALAIAVCVLINNVRERGEQVRYAVIEAPVGQRVRITLPDGTDVWLNSQSRLSYPNNFGSGNKGKNKDNTRSAARIVTLEGEGLFNVKKDPQRPFTVKTKALAAKVTGTTFNFRAYADAPPVVTLTEGAIEVTAEGHSLALTPGEQATLKDNRLTAKKIDHAENVTLWTTGGFCYNDCPLAEIARDMERRFGISVNIQDRALAQVPFTLKAGESATAEQLLRYLKATKEIDFHIEQNTVIITNP
jgi:ferric-dicitrate binding protein FerR (iron transport regulator)